MNDLSVANNGLLGNSTYFGFPVRTNYPSEDRFYKGRKDVAGMYNTESKNITLNPFARNINKEAVAKLEGIRGWMNENNIVPDFELTKKQKEFLAGTREAVDIEGGKIAKQTIASRILVGDLSAQDITPEQTEWVNKIVMEYEKEHGAIVKPYKSMLGN